MRARFVVLFLSAGAIATSLALPACSVDVGANGLPRCTAASECPSGLCYRGFCLGQADATLLDSGLDSGMDPMRDASVDAGIDATEPTDATIDSTDRRDVGADAPGDAGSDAFVGTPCTTATECDDGDSCSGAESCDGFCMAGVRAVDGTECDVDSNITTRDLCLMARCARSRCGDRYVDGTASEQCDDGNSVIGDGCDDCRFTCETPADCDDGIFCNGDEICTGAHTCTRGAMRTDGLACAGGGSCTGGSCRPATCTTSAACSDGNECNGAEQCTMSACTAGTLRDCGDGMDCTRDTCTPGLGCTHELIDGDSDGYSPNTGPTAGCGGDCDDANSRVNPGAAEICGDGVDNNCNGVTDTDAASLWYPDCDGDGYAAAGATSVSACTPPLMAPMVCVGGMWTARAPGGAMATDCNDANAAVNPGQAVYQTTAIAGAPTSIDYDYNCDASEQMRPAAHGSCTLAGLACTLVEGWSGAAPACGSSAPWVRGCTFTALPPSCVASTESRSQGCL